MEFWISAGPILLAIAGFVLSNELRRIQKELVDIRQEQKAQAVQMAHISEKIQSTPTPNKAVVVR